MLLAALERISEGDLLGNSLQAKCSSFLPQHNLALRPAGSLAESVWLNPWKEGSQISCSRAWATAQTGTMEGSPISKGSPCIPTDLGVSEARGP